MRKKSLALSLMLAFSCLLGGNLMAQTSLPYTQGFEGLNNLPTGWISLAGTSSINTQAAYVLEGSKSLKMSGSTTDARIIVMPQFTEEANTLQITFSHMAGGSSHGNLYIGYVTDISDASSFVSVQNYAASTHTIYNEEYVTMTSAPSGSRIAFKHEPTGSTQYVNWYIDDIAVEKIGSCMKPRTLGCSTYSEHSATLVWTAGADGQEDFDIVISNVALADPSTGTIHALTNLEQLTYNATGLSTHTTYYAYVRANCGDSQSLWEKTTFTTACGSVDLTFSYGFEEESDLDCWTLNNCHNNTKITSSYTSSGSKKFTFNNDSGKNPQTLITPELNTNEDGVSVELYYRASSGGGTPKLKIAYSTTDNSVASFDWTNCIEVTANTTSYNKLACDFQVNGINYIAIQFDRNGSSYNIYIDDIRISNIPVVNLPYEYGFENASELENWRMKNCYSQTGIKDVYKTGSYGFGFMHSNNNATQYLITPLLKGTSNGALISLYKKIASTNGNLQFGYSTGDNIISSFTFGSVISETDSDFKYYEFYCPANTKYICIRYNGSNYSNSTLYIDDIRIVTFDKVSNGLYWNNTADWSPVGVPSDAANLYINHAMTIPNACTAEANNIILGPSGSLTIEDGGQLILPKTSTGVQATVKKETYAATPKDAKSYYWYAISSAVANPNISSATNLITETVAPYHYDLYRYNEEKNAELPWENYKNTAYSSTFTTLEKGRGYLYRNASNLSIEMTGEINVADFNYSITNSGGPLAGFNLIGNPYSHDIYKGAGTAIPNSTDFLRTGFYYMEPTTGKWTAGTDNSTAIKPNQGILVQTDKSDNIEMTNTNASSSAKANNDNIMFKVANSQYSDEAYAWFDKGRGLNKISHRNAEVPMLYINQDGENYAIATMSDDIKTFSLNFKAMTMGKYTLSYKTKGEFNYLHVIDRFTGEDVDMLLEGEYSFVASPNDSDARFIVRLEYTSNNGTNDSSVFAYQSGNEIIVSGEGELQIFDVMGRKISTHQINGVETINVNAHGLYIFKLNEKTQKIIIK